MSEPGIIVLGVNWQPGHPIEGEQPALLPCIRFDRSEEEEQWRDRSFLVEILAAYPPGHAVARSPSTFPPNTVFIDAKGNRYKGPDGQCSWPPNVPDLVSLEIYGNHGHFHRSKFRGLVNPEVEPLNGRGMFTERRRGE